MIARVLPARRIDQPRAFGRVAVLLGGSSAEREISIMTGRAVLAALKRQGIDARAIDTQDDAIGKLLAGGFDRAWIALHGRGGEDGTVQGALEYLGIPYTGSGVLGSALSMDKLRSKRLIESSGLATPRYRVLKSDDDCAAAVRELGLPLIVKPAHEGSSVGLSKVEAAAEMRDAWQAAASIDTCVFAEQWITGAEYTAGIIGDCVLPLVRIETDNSFYDYEAKYFSDDTRYFCPSGLAAADESRFCELSLAAFEAVGASGWGRVDFLLDGDSPLFLEVNTVPGMTGHSLVPMAAKAAGSDFDDLVWRILETSFRAQDQGGAA